MHSNTPPNTPEKRPKKYEEAPEWMCPRKSNKFYQDDLKAFVLPIPWSFEANIDVIDFHQPLEASDDDLNQLPQPPTKRRRIN
jgi:hypothetical protein